MTSEGTKELDQGQVNLPEGIMMYWERDEGHGGYRTYYIGGEKIFVAKYPGFVIAAAVAVESTLAHEEKRIYGS